MRATAALVIAITLMLFVLPRAQAASGVRSVDATYGRQMLRMINHDRAVAGLPALHWGSRLERAALLHSQDMATRGYLAHNNLAGATPYDRMGRQGVHYTWAGENIGYDQGGNQDTMLRAIETAMLQSPEHRANLLRRTFDHVGIGVVLLGDKIYITEDFRG